MAQTTDMERAARSAVHRWTTPFPGFTSGHDPRTSDAALLSLVYGGLRHAADHDWQNAGRRLIDKTYIDILWHVQSLTAIRACSAEAIAANLDNFIRDHIRPVWHDLPSLDNTDRATLAGQWIDEVAQGCFGSLHSEAAASRLLFFLCPMLPVFNLSRGHLLALDRLGHAAAGDSYAHYARSAAACLAALDAPAEPSPPPTVHQADPAQRGLIQHLIDTTDWWRRRVFDAYLVQTVDPDGSRSALFACDAAGALISEAGVT